MIQTEKKKRLPCPLFVELFVSLHINTRLICDRQLTDMRPTVDRYATDSWPICHRQLTDMRPTVDRYTTDSWPTYQRQLTDMPPIVDRHINDSWPIYHRHMTDIRSTAISTASRYIDHQSAISTASRSTVDRRSGRQSIDSRLTVDRHSIDSRSIVSKIKERKQPYLNLIYFLFAYESLIFFSSFSRQHFRPSIYWTSF